MEQGRVPLVGPRKPLHVLKAEYKNPVFHSKIDRLRTILGSSSRSKSDATKEGAEEEGKNKKNNSQVEGGEGGEVEWRGVRGDGNCFYRAFAVAFVEVVLMRRFEEASKFVAMVEDAGVRKLFGVVEAKKEVDELKEERRDKDEDNEEASRTMNMSSATGESGSAMSRNARKKRNRRKKKQGGGGHKKKTGDEDVYDRVNSLARRIAAYHDSPTTAQTPAPETTEPTESTSGPTSAHSDHSSENDNNKEDKRNKLLRWFEADEDCDAFVKFLRKLTAEGLGRSSELHIFIEAQGQTLLQRCTVAETMGEEAEQLEIIGLLRMFADVGEIKVSCVLYQLDREAGEPTRYVLPDEGGSVGNDGLAVHLLFRPGHYDVLYSMDR